MLYKVLDAYGGSCNGGRANWYLPYRGDGPWTPGAWMPEIQGKLIPCVNGYHLARDAQVTEWLNAALYEAEYEGECVEEDNKIVVRKVRLLRKLNWDESKTSKFCCWCALSVAHLWPMPKPVRRALNGDDAKVHDSNFDLALGKSHSAMESDAIWAAFYALNRRWDVAPFSAAWAKASEAALNRTEFQDYDVVRNAAHQAAISEQYRKFLSMLEEKCQ